MNRGQEAVTIRQAEMLNNRVQNLERAFIFEQGIYAERTQYRHLVFTSSEHNDYGGVLFAGIMDPAVRWRNAYASGDLSRANHWLETVKISFTKLQYAIESAILTLNLQGFYD